MIDIEIQISISERSSGWAINYILIKVVIIMMVMAMIVMMMVGKPG